MAGQGGFITITISGGEQLQLKARQIATWGMLVQSLQPAFEQIGEDLLGDFAQNMVRGGGMFGTASRWPPLAPSTIADKERKGYGAMPPMWRTGALAHSLAERGVSGNIFEAGANYVVVGSSVEYAIYHQLGSRKTKTVVNSLRAEVPRHRRFSQVAVLPQRMLVGISWTRRSLIVRRLNEFVQEMARRAGLAMNGKGGTGGRGGGGGGGE